METFWCPRFQPEAFSVCALIYFNSWGCFQDGRTLIHFPPTDLRPISCPSVRRIHSSPHESDWPWWRRSGPFLTLLHTHVLLQLANLSLLGGIRNTDGVYGIWEILIEQFSDRGKGLETPSKWKSAEAFSPKSFLQKKKNLNFEIKISWLSDLHSSLICIKALDNHGSYLCSLRPKLEAALRLICSKLRKSWKETLQLLSPNSYNLI